ncbi:hypothetical protein [Dactylosporangium sp. CA-233914]|uniref:hypothetical protein n=1 Tax=Dactylosporangium sp. CA-233914 TaxID=3239934 RepID=UPI003D8F13F1
MALVVRRDAERRFESDLRTMFERTVWHTGGCRSWYQTDAPSGTLLWPDSTVRYRWRLHTLRRDDFDFLHAPAADSPAASDPAAGAPSEG